MAKRATEYTAKFKASVVGRMCAGEAVSVLSAELGIRRKVLYDWKQKYKQGGEAALARGRGRPRGSRPALQAKPAKQLGGNVAELERLVGRQQALIDFFEQALSAVDPLLKEGSGKAPCSRPSGGSESRSLKVRR